MSFDTIESDYMKLALLTEKYPRKRLSKKGFTISGSLNECKELTQLVSKKLTINVEISPYKFASKNSNKVLDYRPEIIEGCNFHFGGLIM